VEGERGSYLSLRGGKEQRTSDSYIKYYSLCAEGV